MLKVLLCLCLCLAVALAQEEEPPKEPELEVYARNRRQADGFPNPMGAMKDAMQQIPGQMGAAFGEMVNQAKQIPNMMMGGMSGMGQNTRRRREVPHEHPHPPPPPQGEGNMSQGKK